MRSLNIRLYFYLNDANKFSFVEQKAKQFYCLFLTSFSSKPDLFAFRLLSIQITKKEGIAMNTTRESPFLFTVLSFLAYVLFVPATFADEMTQSLMFDDASYTAEVENAHHKLHMLYGKAVDKSVNASQRLKARREFLDVAQDLNKKMHARVMTKDPKKGDALSHTDVLMSTHLLLMTADMLTAIKQDEWAMDPGLTGSE